MASFDYTKYLSIDTLEAKVQNRVGKFLSGKEVLINGTHSNNPQIAGRARKLLKEQKSLEGGLPSVLQDIKNKKTDIQSLLSNTMFYYNMEKQIKNVDAFRKGAKSSSNIVGINTDFLTGDMLKYGLFGIGILMLVRKPTLFGATTTAIGGYLMSKDDSQGGKT